MHAHKLHDIVITAATFMVGALLFAVLTGCSPSTDPVTPDASADTTTPTLVGTWAMDIPSLDQRIVLSSEGHVTISYWSPSTPDQVTTDTGTWSSTDTTITLVMDLSWIGTLPRDYVLQGDALTLTDPTGRSGLFAVGMFTREPTK